MSTNETAKLEILGKTMKTMLPSGRIFTIREQNGNDDDILSNPVTKADLTNIDNFLTAIVLSEEKDGQSIPITLKDITELPNNDRYHILIQSRVFSLGNDMTFTFDWGDQGGVVTYVEDLSQYLHDYTKKFPEPGDKDYFEFKIPPYPANSDIGSRFEFIITNGKKFKFGLFTRQSEKIAMTLPQEELTRNKELQLRNLELYTEAGYIKVENFGMFSKRDMIEIRKGVLDVDPTYQFVTTLLNPVTKETLSYPLMSGSDFFYPVEI